MRKGQSDTTSRQIEKTLQHVHSSLRRVPRGVLDDDEVFQSVQKDLTERITQVIGVDDPRGPARRTARREEVLTAQCGAYLASVDALLSRLVRDREALSSAFARRSVNVLPSVVAIAELRPWRLPTADSARLLHLAGGACILYQPHPAAFYQQFCALAQWLVQRDRLCEEPMPTVVDGSDCRWVLSDQGAASRTTPRISYRRFGVHLAIAHALQSRYARFVKTRHGSVDFEWIVGDCAFAPRPPAPSWHVDDLARSVIGTGLLPAPASHQRAAAADYMAHGDDGSGTEWRRKVDGTLAETPERVRQLPELIEAFRTTYLLLLRHREELQTPDGIVDRLKRAPRRVFRRPPTAYAAIFQEYIAGTVASTDEEPRDSGESAVLDADERACIEAGVLPSRWLVPSGHDFPHPSERPLDHLSESDLERQTWLIRSSVAQSLTGRVGRRLLPMPPQRLPKQIDPLIESTRIAEHLLRLTVIKDHALHALTISEDHDNQHWRIKPLGFDLHSGLSGLALFFAYAHRVSGDRRFERATEAALAGAGAIVDQLRWSSTNPGFAGLGGHVYALSLIAMLWESPRLARRAMALLPQLERLVRLSRRSDFMSGHAGAIGGLLAIHHLTGDQLSLEAAVNAGDAILRAACRSGDHLAWGNDGAQAEPLTGYAHGAAGIAWALLELYGQSRHQRFRDAAERAIAYERHVFCEEEQNWPDFRLYKGRRFHYAWCHGSAGIGLGRLAATKYLADAELAHEVRIATRSTLRSGFGLNHGLCHGDFGNLELLTGAMPLLADDERRACLDKIDTVLASLGSSDPTSAVPTPIGVAVPGLMLGLAGSGFALLRLAAPTTVPRILTMQLPDGSWQLPRGATMM
jgi:lantibiotic modifying enzyme